MLGTNVFFCARRLAVVRSVIGLEGGLFWLFNFMLAYPLCRGSYVWVCMTLWGVFFFLLVIYWLQHESHTNSRILQFLLVSSLAPSTAFPPQSHSRNCISQNKTQFGIFIMTCHPAVH